MNHADCLKWIWLPLLFFSIGSAAAEPVPRSPSSFLAPSQTPFPEDKVTNPSTQAPATQEVAEGTQLTGDWRGRRKQLSDRGIDLALIYKGEFNQNLEGGLRRRAVYLENIDLRLLVNLEKAANMPGTSLFVYGLVNFGGDRDSSPSTNVGDAQVTSNIETSVDTAKLYEAWVQKKFAEDRASFLLGLHDLNSEFYVTDTSTLFFNSSFGIGKELSQTGVNGPSIFPTTALSARLRWEVTPLFIFQSGAFDAQAGDPENPRGTQIHPRSDNGLLLISEVSILRSSAADEETSGKWALGVWGYTRRFDHLIETETQADGSVIPTQANSRGAYLLVDQKLASQVAVFLRWGHALSEANRFSGNTSAGVVWTGILPGKAENRLGLAVTRVTNGSTYQTVAEQSGNPTTEAETTLELNLRFEVHPGVAVQPSFQYVQNPNTDRTVQDAKVAACRVELNF